MLKRRSVVTVLGLILICLLIWFASDYFYWLQEPRNLFYAMAVPVGLVAAWEVFRRARAAQANSQLANAVVSQGQADQRPSADVVQLRERFEEAVATLKQQKKKGGLGLYELPWYVIVGAPGSGKTTALKYSGLRFPLEQRSGRGALRGVGGTRNCDWWFTEEAVLLDTAGRYTTQDSDASADSTGWAEFLALLKKYRKRRPLNGVLLAISAMDLMTQGQSGREAHVAAARRRLNELNKELRIQLPVYVLVTKCDLIAGFSEYFDDMSQEDRAQVLGVTFPQDVTLKGAAANAFPEEFDAVIERLNERVFSRLEEERDARKRAKIFGFPQQLASLRESLTEYVADIFESTRFDQRVLLRGVYFTSGTQEGTPIDRLLGALSRRFAVASDAVAPGARGKSYFIERLMKQVVLAESGLAGVSRRLEMQKAAAQLALYFGMLAAGAILVLLMLHSYQTNRDFLADYSVRAEEVKQNLPAPRDSAIEARPRLDKVRSLVDIAVGFQDQRWWSAHGWGLDQSAGIEEAAGKVYRDELQQALVGPLKVRIEHRLTTLINSGSPLDLYETLRAYLMLKAPQAPYFDRDEIRAVARREWDDLYRGNEENIHALDEHVAWLLDHEPSETSINETLVDTARGKIPDDVTSVAQLILSGMKRRYERQLDQEGERRPVIDAKLVLRTKSGRALGADFHPVFTKDGFAAAEDLINKAEAQFRNEDDWVWGRRRLANPTGTRSKVSEEYERAYIKAWQGVLDDVGFPSGSDELPAYIIKIAGEQQGLKALLMLVDRHTSLVPAVYAKPPGNLLGTWMDFFQEQAQSGLNSLKGRTKKFGTDITVHFIPVHWMVTPVGDRVRIDELLAKMKVVGTELEKSKPSTVGGGGGGVANQDLSMKAKELQNDVSGLPDSAASITSLIAGLSKAAMTVSAGQLRTAIQLPYDNFLKSCRDTITNRYPFYRTTADVGPQDFERLFGASGALAQLTAGLADYIQKERGIWVAKQLSSGESLNIQSMLEKLNAAERIRDAFFPVGQNRFKFQIEVRELDDRTLKFEFNEILFDDGQRLKYENTKVNPKDAAWPTPKPGTVTAIFTLDNNGRTQSVGGEGHWNWFRLIEDHGTLEKQTDTVFLLTLQARDAWAKLKLTAYSSTNPYNLFLARTLQSFRCD